MNPIQPRKPRIQLDTNSYRSLHADILSRVGGGANIVENSRISRSITGNFGVDLEMILQKTRLRSVLNAIAQSIAWE